MVASAAVSVAAIDVAGDVSDPEAGADAADVAAVVARLLAVGALEDAEPVTTSSMRSLIPELSPDALLDVLLEDPPEAQDATAAAAMNTAAAVRNTCPKGPAAAMCTRPLRAG